MRRAPQITFEFSDVPHHQISPKYVVDKLARSCKHRLYGRADVSRLYRICSLRNLGLSLFEIGRALGDDEWDVTSVLLSHLKAIDAQLTEANTLRSRLTGILVAATGSPDPLTDELLEVMEQMAMMNSEVKQRLLIMVYADIEAGVEHLRKVFGLGPAEITRDPDGNPVHAAIEAGDGVIWLHPESPDFGLASPQTLGGTTGMMAVMVDDVGDGWA